LAALRPDGYVLLEEICADEALPRHFVAKILQDLVRKGLLISARGRGGGFALAYPPRQITLYDVVERIDGTEWLDECIVGMAQCDNEQPCPLHDQWKAMRERMYEFLTTTTLEQMSWTLQRKLKLMGQSLQSAPQAYRNAGSRRHTE
jgi:Rrf2 family protein